jgi:hypothetical protein
MQRYQECYIVTEQMPIKIALNVLMYRNTACKDTRYI